MRTCRPMGFGGVRYSLWLRWFVMAALSAPLYAEVAQSAPDGFQVRLVREIECEPLVGYRALVADLGEWWDSSHSYTGDSDNLSMDLQRNCMLEVLPDGGFVRHMEIVFHQPGKMLRLSGGLGPLQGMGVSGTMTFQFEETEGNTQMTLTYTVTGAAFQQLDKVAVPVDQVLSSQVDRWQHHCVSTMAASE